MITEKTKCRILKVFGYNPEDLNCANADTAMGEIVDQDSTTPYMDTIELFILNCSSEDFAELKELFRQDESEEGQ